MKPDRTSRWKLLYKCETLLLIFIHVKVLAYLFFFFRQFLLHRLPKQTNIKSVGSVNSQLPSAACDANCSSKETEEKHRRVQKVAM